VRFVEIRLNLGSFILADPAEPRHGAIREPLTRPRKGHMDRIITVFGPVVYQHGARIKKASTDHGGDKQLSVPVPQGTPSKSLNPEPTRVPGWRVPGDVVQERLEVPRSSRPRGAEPLRQVDEFGVFKRAAFHASALILSRCLLAHPWRYIGHRYPLTFARLQDE
jgi:hypothetical protein